MARAAAHRASRPLPCQSCMALWTKRNPTSASVTTATATMPTSSNGSFARQASALRRVSTAKQAIATTVVRSATRLSTTQMAAMSDAKKAQTMSWTNRRGRRETEANANGARTATIVISFFTTSSGLGTARAHASPSAVALTHDTTSNVAAITTPTAVRLTKITAMWRGASTHSDRTKKSKSAGRSGARS